MVDIVLPEVRARMMSAIKSKNTKPEMVIRCGLHALGFRYKLHDPSLPGKPDLVFPKYRAIILVNGCFWHMHGCDLFKLPATRTDFWLNKLERNRSRDLQNIRTYMDSGWRVLIVWECALKGKDSVGTTTVLRQCAAWLIAGDQLENIERHDEDKAII